MPNFPFVFRQLMGLTVFLAMAQGLFAQEEEVLDNRRIKYLVLTDSITQIDSLSISPDDFSAKIDSVDIEPEKYMLNWRSAELQWLGKLPTDTIQLIYRVYPVNFSEDIFIRDTTIIIPDDLSNFDPYVYRPDEESTLFQESFSLDKSGSITRGIAFGNRQDLSVNSSLDLQLNGKLNDRISVLASVSDKNIPIQPEGNTQQLQDFDQLYIQLYDDRNTLHAGDFILSHAQGPFLRYQKNAQGLNYNFKNNRFKLESSVAISKGRFAQNRIQGIEGNQGPYRLRGNDGEPFIIILSGSERVFIDGKLLERGQNRDYIINYNTAEISFTARNPITKDKRIQVEFQYSVKSYARSMLQTSVANSNDAWSWYIDAYAEQDAKNQPLQQDLDADDKQALSDAGDILNTAFVNGVDSVAYNADLILYAQIDSLGFSPVYLQTNNPDSANYQVIFTQVGSGNGDYVEGDFTANGKVYVWIAPEFIDGQWVHYGDYAPIRLLTAPEKQQMIAGGVSRRIGEKNSVSLNAAVSNRDLNTFSSIGNSDNVGLAVKGSWDFASKPEKGEVEREKWYFSSGVDAEHVARNFRRVERFRSMEFNRDWNLSNTEGRDLYLYGARFGVNRVENGQAELSVKRLDLEGYTGVRSAFNSDMAVKGLRWIEEASYTSNKEAFSGEFLRHRGHLTWQRGLLKWGYRDEFERNDRTQSGDILSGSYGFYDYETYLSTSDSLKNEAKVFYRNRRDLLPDAENMALVADAIQYGLSFHWKTHKRHKLNGTLSRRELKIKRDDLLDIEPENTFLGQVNHSFRSNKNWLISSTFYEWGSGLEQKREFIYLEVPAGQGVYVWNDYNEDGIRDLNEFEVAAFDYEANYIRTFLPSDEYEKVHSQVFSQNLQLDPSAVWRNSEGILKLLSKFATNTTLRLEGKNNGDVRAEGFNPFVQNVADSTLILYNGLLRQSVYFMRGNPVFALEYSYQENKTKSLLVNGFELRQIDFHEVVLRTRIQDVYAFQVTGRMQEKDNSSDFLSGRNFEIEAVELLPTLTYVPDPSKSIALISRISDKKTTNIELPASSTFFELGLEGKLNSPGKGSVRASFSRVDIDYSGENNSALSFELLEGLNPGINYTWFLGFQRKVSKNIQIDLTYQGRLSDGNSAIHSGGMSARAFF